VEKGDTLTVRDLSIALKDLPQSAGAAGVLPMAVPRWADAFLCGASFHLRGALDAGRYVVDGNVIEVGPNGRSLNVALTAHHPDVLFQAYSIAEKTLDVLAVEAYQLGDLVDVPREHCIWWRTGGITNLRSVSTVRMAAEMHLRLEVTGPDGQIRPPTPRAPQRWNGSHAYFRRSQLTDNLHDAYRYLFLALEAVLSQVYPWQQNMGEGAWLQAALKHVCEGYGISLASHNAVKTGNPYRRFMREQYNAQRCALFHSKLDRDPILPGDQLSREELAAAVRRLGVLYVELSRRITGAGFAGGAMTYSAFEDMFQKSAEVDLYISTERDFQIDMLVISAAERELRVSGPAVHCMKAQFDKSVLPGSGIRRAGSLMQSPDGRCEALSMEADIDVWGVDIVECVFQVEFANARHLKEWYL
jgi:hypothetical protein